MDSFAVAQALRQTPLPRGVALLMRKDDISQPRIEPHPEVAGAFIAAIYVVRKNGLPLYLPACTKRLRKKLFVATVVASADSVTNAIRFENAAAQLLQRSRVRMARYRGGKKSGRTRRRDGTLTAGPGRPRGISQAMEKTGSNPRRLCLDCGRRHKRLLTPCRPEEREKWQERMP
jgi:hypothetical protein